MKLKNSALYLIAASIIFTGIGVSSKENSVDEDTRNKSGDKVQQLSGKKKILVVYFSHTGNTREIAGQIHKLAGGDIIEIQPLNTYPDDYEALKKIAKNELNSGDKPALKNKINISSYDIIFIGYPIWWGTFPAPVKTLLSENDFTGKTIVPFNTHLGSGQGVSVKDIEKLCPNAALLEGLSIWGNDTKTAQNKVAQWLRKIGIIK